MGVIYRIGGVFKKIKIFKYFKISYNTWNGQILWNGRVFKCWRKSDNTLIGQIAWNVRVFKCFKKKWQYLKRLNCVKM